MGRGVAFVVLWVAGRAFAADCFEHHASRFGLDPALLRAIAWVESGGKPGAINDGHVARTGSRDIGLMQINSSWLPRLAASGIQERDLLRPCTSIEIAAWLLHDLVRRYGNTWDAVGAYNASCRTLSERDCVSARARYAWKVFDRQPRSQARQPLSGGAATRPLVVAAKPNGPMTAGMVSLAAAERS